MTTTETMKVRLTTALAMLLIVSLQYVMTEPSHAAELIWTGDFETGDFSQYSSKLTGEGKQSKRSIITSPVRGGRYATELTVLANGSNGVQRAELVTRQKKKGGKIAFKWDGPEYWIGFSFMFKEWDANALTFFQVHGPNEQKGSRCDMAGNAFSIWGDGGKRIRGKTGISTDIAVRVIENGGKSSGTGAASNNIVVHKYPIPINEWQDYVVNFKLSTKGQGFYKVWKNGKAVYTKSGLTNVNHLDSCGQKVPENKRQHNGVYVGIYSPGNPAYRRIFYDEVRVATGANGYDLVSPGSKSKSKAQGTEADPKPPVFTIAAD